MIDNLINYLRNKKILILGFGREGQSTYKLIRKHLKNQLLYIADEKKDFQEEYSFLQEDNYIKFISGDKYLDNLEDYDIIMKTPGISFVGIDTTNFLYKIKSQMELFLEFFDVFTIGVTGTKGKSTTSSLIYKILRDQNVKSLLLGNIGVPVFDYIDDIEKDTIIVLEMSSHQLEYMKKSTNISIILNIYEEHLDHYKTLEDYAKAKCNIFKYQKENDYFLHSIDSEILNKELKKCHITGKEYKISLEDRTSENNKLIVKDDKVYIGDKVLYNTLNKRNLLGKYNLSNLMFALAVNEILNLNLSKTIDTINNFQPLPHRIERVGEFNGITYYNDSIATIPEATINSIEALENVNTLIIGGMDRGVNFEKFIEYLNNSKIENLICMPETGHSIGKKITNKKIKVYMVEAMEDAVNTAKKVTKENMICLLSPAAASYGFFKNFKEKGEIYKKLVRESVLPN